MSDSSFHSPVDSHTGPHASILVRSQVSGFNPFAFNNIIETFVISELTEIQRYWGKKELQVLQTAMF